MAPNVDAPALFAAAAEVLEQHLHLTTPIASPKAALTSPLVPALSAAVAEARKHQLHPQPLKDSLPPPSLATIPYHFFPSALRSCPEITCTSSTRDTSNLPSISPLLRSYQQQPTVVVPALAAATPIALGQSLRLTTPIASSNPALTSPPPWSTTTHRCCPSAPRSRRGSP